MTNPNASQVRVYRAADAPPGALAGESVAVLGYGHLGRTAALNLRDSGAKVRIGNREDEYAEQARAEGFEVVPITTALADGMGVLRAGAVQMSAKVEGTLDLFIEQTVGSVLGMAIMMAFEVARDAGIPAEALVLEMYMSGEMEAVFQSFRETGFFRASEDHGPTAVFGGITRSLEMDREAMAESFRKTLEDIKSGGFAQRFQEEARNGYPMLEFARAMMHGGSPITEAEDRVRHLTSPDPSGSSPGT